MSSSFKKIPQKRVCVMTDQFEKKLWDFENHYGIQYVIVEVFNDSNAAQDRTPG
jgi:hypothetical protein